jgi:hypothetical protein
LFLKAKQTEGRMDHDISNESATRQTCSGVNSKLTRPSPGSRTPEYSDIGLKQAELCNDGIPGTVADLEWGPAALFSPEIYHKTLVKLKI